MRKADEIANPNSCLNKAADDEPIFVLRAKDPLAAELVRDWARRAGPPGPGQPSLHEPEKITEALEHADRMDFWRTGVPAPVEASPQEPEQPPALTDADAPPADDLPIAEGALDQPLT